MSVPREPPEHRLGRDECAPGHAFSNPENTLSDRTVMRDMLSRLRAQAGGQLGVVEGVRSRDVDAEGHSHLIVISRPAALLAARDMSLVGFFGQARSGIDQAPLFELDNRVVATIPAHPDILCYYDMGLPHGLFGNLVLCSSRVAIEQWRENEWHRQAVEVTARYYHSVRLHRGHLDGTFLGDHDIEISATTYLDFDPTHPWRAVRNFD